MQIWILPYFLRPLKSLQFLSSRNKHFQESDICLYSAEYIGICSLPLLFLHKWNYTVVCIILSKYALSDDNYRIDTSECDLFLNLFRFSFF
jgi:hypothetical protein